MKCSSGLITDRSEYAKWRQKHKKGESREKKTCTSVHLKMGKEKKNLHSFCVFGYKVGRTIFTACDPPHPTPHPPAKPSKIHFHSNKESLEKVNQQFSLSKHPITYYISQTGVLPYKLPMLLILYTLQNIHSTRISSNVSAALVLALFHNETKFLFFGNLLPTC